MKVVIAGIVGGLIVFVWGAVSHMLTPIGTMGFTPLPNEDALVSAMKTSLTEPGMYMFPGFDMNAEMTPEQEKAWTDKMMAGPTGMIIYHPTGEQPMSPKQLGVELLSNIVAALLAAMLLTRFVGSYACRVVMVAVLGLFAWMSIDVSYWNWYGFASAQTIGELLEQVIGWALAGLAMAKMVKVKSA